MQINANLIKSAREARHWSQEELAIAAGISIRTVQRAEGEGSASLQTMKSLSAALELESEALVLTGPANAETPNWTWMRTGILILIGLLLLTGGGFVFFDIGQEQKDEVIDEIQALTGQKEAVQEIGIQDQEIGIQEVKKEYQIPDNWQDLPLSEKILGHWETNYLGTWSTLNMDGKYTNPGGSIKGNANYTLRDNIISYGFNKRIVSSRIVFPEPTTMVWHSVETDAIVIIFYRNAPPLLSSEEILEQMLGDWVFQSDLGSGSLEVTEKGVVFVYPDGSVVKSYFDLSGKVIRFNQESRIVYYVVNFHRNGVMTWIVPNTDKELAFVRQSK